MNFEDFCKNKDNIKNAKNIENNLNTSYEDLLKQQNKNIWIILQGNSKR